MTAEHDLREQLASLHEISVEIAALRDLPTIYERALRYCLELTGSTMGFVDLCRDDKYAMDVVAVIGFEPIDPHFFERFHRMPVRPSVFGVVVTEGRPYISNDVEHDPLSVGQPPGHPRVHTFLGVPLRIGERVIGMIGVGNRPHGYDDDHARLLTTFANQVAVAIENARLDAHQREMIAGLSSLQLRLGTAERDQLLALERDRIAAGLHDEIEQQLFSIGLELSSLLDGDDLGDLPAGVGERIRRARQLAAQTSDKVHEVVFALGVEGHGGPDLTSSIRKLLDEVAAPAGLAVELAVKGTHGPGVSYVQGAVHAVVRQAIANAVQHARAGSLLVTLHYQPDRLEVVVQDDGVGMGGGGDGDRAGLHFGVANMRRQVHALGGTFSIADGDDGGVTVRIVVPITPPLERS
jgi:signal transduction histidine kinase